MEARNSAAIGAARGEVERARRRGPAWNRSPRSAAARTHSSKAMAGCVAVAFGATWPRDCNSLAGASSSVVLAPFIKIAPFERLLNAICADVRVDVFTRWLPGEVSDGSSLPWLRPRHCAAEDRRRRLMQSRPRGRSPTGRRLSRARSRPLGPAASCRWRSAGDSGRTAGPGLSRRYRGRLWAALRAGPERLANPGRIAVSPSVRRFGQPAPADVVADLGGEGHRDEAPRMAW